MTGVLTVRGETRRNNRDCFVLRAPTTRENGGGHPNLMQSARSISCGMIVMRHRASRSHPANTFGEVQP